MITTALPHSRVQIAYQATAMSSQANVPGAPALRDLVPALSQYLEVVRRLWSTPQPSYLLSTATLGAAVTTLDRLPPSQYLLKKPIPVTVEWPYADEVVAAVEGVGIAASGSTVSEAIANLGEEIVDAMSIYDSGERLGRELQRRKIALEKYVGEAGR
jgi:hypothetical protein